MSEASQAVRAACTHVGPSLPRTPSPPRGSCRVSILTLFLRPLGEVREAPRGWSFSREAPHTLQRLPCLCCASPLPAVLWVEPLSVRTANHTAGHAVGHSAVHTTNHTTGHAVGHRASHPRKAGASTYCTAAPGRNPPADTRGDRHNPHHVTSGSLCLTRAGAGGESHHHVDGGRVPWWC